MRSLSLTMPAALLLLLSIACNHHATFSGESKMDTVQSADKTADKEASPGLFSQALVDSSAVIADDNTGKGEAPQAVTIANQTHQPAGALPASASPQANPDWDKKIVKTATLNLEVKNFKLFSQALHTTVRGSGGYIAQEEQSSSDYKIQNTVVIKVPVAQFDETVLRFESDSDKIVEKKISSEDVTMNIIDTRSRMENKREVREKYLDLLKQARNMNEIIKVQNELNGVQEEIEGASGRIAYLGHAAAFSTINLSFYQVLDPGAKNTSDPSFLHKLKDAFAEGWSWVSGLVFTLISLWPLFLAVGLSWIGYRKWKTSARQKHRSPDPA